MKEKPILFNQGMVKAILEDRKFQTRRVIKLPSYVKQQDNGLFTLFAEGTCYQDQHMEQITEYIKCPYGQIGDILWVRETWKEFHHPEHSYAYKADGIDYAPWHPSIHMPREAARLFLTVKDRRIERLQDITEDDCIAEGIENIANKFYSNDGVYIHESPIEAYKSLWNMLNFKRGFPYELNPFCWVVEFERVAKL